jgi:hypothetical protein
MIARNLSAKVKVAANQNIKDRDYWLNRLSGEIEKSYFPYDKEPTGKTALSFAVVSFDIPAETGARLLSMKKRPFHRSSS